MKRKEREAWRVEEVKKSRRGGLTEGYRGRNVKRCGGQMNKIVCVRECKRERENVRM